ncbi:hypothetical protein C2S52_019629 [Perilla frutescens var. hirtella]|uniref:Protein BIC1 n=1 Tax=Perilla frutescens var. hirtella TaxID=608512 RepID=A0AAD4JB39_PERFH|nr:hypothetical protein C2S52_019629 [Perilla frutescens var. hirtella]KAH6806118.1 hypothetical protein C2S51_030949 [Perilla frutescens var. frutescens]KAH6830533.1 hypothetical protein C2S53_010451 [Perilla frutescens var. hirtella]
MTSSQSHNEEAPAASNKTSTEPQDPEPSFEESKKNKTHGREEEAEGREKLKRHRVEVAGRVWIPDIWGQEEFLKDWIDCVSFDAALVSSRILMARDSLMEEPRRDNSTTLRILN